MLTCFTNSYSAEGRSKYAPQSCGASKPRLTHSSRVEQPTTATTLPFQTHLATRTCINGSRRRGTLNTLASLWFTRAPALCLGSIGLENTGQQQEQLENVFQSDTRIVGPGECWSLYSCWQDCFESHPNFVLR